MSEVVLVTGGAGFIGRRTVDRLLQEGASVRVLDNLHPQVHPGGCVPGDLSPEAELIRGDVRDLDAVRRAAGGVTRVVHLAAETSVGQSMFESDHHIDVNVRGTAVVMRALREEGADIDRFVLSSSRAVYGEGANRCDRCGTTVNPGPRRAEDLAAAVWTHRCTTCGGPLRAVPTVEDLPPGYCSAYGMTKFFQEEVARTEADQLGIPLVVLRYFNVYGPGQSLDNPYTGLINTLALRLLAGKELVLYEDGTPLRDFVHVDDVVEATVAATLGRAPDQRVLNIGVGEAIPLTTLSSELGQAFEREPYIVRSPRFRLGDIHAAIADISRAREAIGYAPSISIGAGLAGLVDDIEAAGADDRSDDVEDEMRARGVLRG